MTKNNELLQEYWTDRLSDLKNRVEIRDDEINSYVKIKGKKPPHNSDDLLLDDMYELVSAIVECRQWENCINGYDKVKRVCRIMTRSPRSELEKNFNIKTISLYGVGLYVIVEGVLLSYTMRNLINYDNSFKRKQFIKLDKAEGLEKEYDFRLISSAFGTGLFIPKKSALTSSLSRAYQLQYLDIDQDLGW